jgi:tetratricopeptide (TPR) repeat protein
MLWRPRGVVKGAGVSRTDGLAEERGTVQHGVMRRLGGLALSGMLSCTAPAAAGPDEPARAKEAVARDRLGTALDLLRSGGEASAGIELLRQAVAGAPPSASDVRVEARRWIGHVLNEQGDPEGALVEYRLALEEAPGDPWLHYAAGVAWSRMGELERSIESFTRAVELDPAHVKALQWRGELHHDRGEERAAVDDLTRALEAVDRADEVALRAWGGDRRQLLLHTLATRASALEALGEHERAQSDRERRAALLGGD